MRRFPTTPNQEYKKISNVLKFSALEMIGKDIGGFTLTEAKRNMVSAKETFWGKQGGISCSFRKNGGSRTTMTTCST